MKIRRIDEEHLRERIQAAFKEAYQKKETQIGADVMRQFEKAVMLQTLIHAGVNIWLRWIICVKVFICVAMRKKILSKNINVNRLNCFRQLLDKINYDVISALSKFEVKVEARFGAIRSAASPRTE